MLDVMHAVAELRRHGALPPPKRRVRVNRTQLVVQAIEQAGQEVARAVGELTAAVRAAGGEGAQVRWSELDTALAKRIESGRPLSTKTEGERAILARLRKRRVEKETDE